MSGTVAGGRKARDKNLARDPQFYKKIGKIGGHASSDGGFASHKRGKDGLTGFERASIVGTVGGRKSRRNHPNNVNLSNGQ